MIRINLLPKEMRKNQRREVPREAIIMAAGGLLSILFLLGYLYIAHIRIPDAKARLKKDKKELARVTAIANEVDKIKDEIAKVDKRLATLRSYLGRKIYWAETLNDFTHLVGTANDGEWKQRGFQIAVRRLDFSTSAGKSGGRSKAKKDSISANFKWQLEMVGTDFDRSGEYIVTFFDDLKSSRFWLEHGFQGDPVEEYKGERPRSTDDVPVIIEWPMDFLREQPIRFAAATAKKGK